MDDNSNDFLNKLISYCRDKFINMYLIYDIRYKPNYQCLYVLHINELIEINIDDKKTIKYYINKNDIKNIKHTKKFNTVKCVFNIKILYFELSNPTYFIYEYKNLIINMDTYFLIKGENSDLNNIFNNYSLYNGEKYIEFNHRCNVAFYKNYNDIEKYVFHGSKISTILNNKKI
jgi:hypothetical protein